MTNRRAFLSSLAGLVAGGAVAAVSATSDSEKAEPQTIIIRLNPNHDQIKRVILADFNSEHGGRLRDILTKTL